MIHFLSLFFFYCCISFLVIVDMLAFSTRVALLFFALIYYPGGQILKGNLFLNGKPNPIYATIVRIGSHNVDGAASNKCGVSGFTLGERIVGGESISVRRQPWYVALVSTSQTTGNNKNRRPGQKEQKASVFCGATLITNKHILTAGHCYYTLRAQGGNWKSKLTAVFGLSNRCTSTWSSVVRIANVEIHPRFNINTLKNDIALATLQKTVSFTIACMPGQNAMANQTADIVGYGTLEEGGKEPCTLQEANITVYSRAACLRTEIGPLVRNIPAALCAGRQSGSVDTCQGDSGGPLLIQKNGQYVLHGITSFGNGCGRPDSPGVYTNVYAYKQWINFRIAASNSRGRR